VSRAFRGQVNIDIRDSRPDWRSFEQPRARDGVPNIVLVAIDRLARNGLRYSNWHTTALSSATGACLLTGRNHTTAGMACLTEAPSGFPTRTATSPLRLGHTTWRYELGAAPGDRPTLHQGPLAPDRPAPDGRDGRPR
jgi:hypothetical protein